jgi:hypothetical protein
MALERQSLQRFLPCWIAREFMLLCGLVMNRKRSICPQAAKLEGEYLKYGMVFSTLILTGCSGFVPTRAPSVPPQIVNAWGNSQTQGYGLQGCSILTCHPETAWPAVMAVINGWTLNNQAYGASNCADLSYAGTSQSLWDVKVDAVSKNIYGHFRNDQARYGQAYIAYARGCIEAQTAWLAIPEADKTRAAGTGCVKTGTWVDGNPNSAASYTSTAGATMTCTVTGSTIYFAAARQYNSSATFTVSVDGVKAVDPDSGITIFSQADVFPGGSGLPVNQKILANLIRVSSTNATHKVVYTCVDPAGDVCLAFYTAAVGAVETPVVYSLSTIYNAPAEQTGNMDAPTTDLYHAVWLAMVAELTGDGLNIIPIDATIPAVYNSATQSQDDGVHENVLGHASIGAHAAAQ